MTISIVTYNNGEIGKTPYEVTGENKTTDIHGNYGDNCQMNSKIMNILLGKI